MLNRTGRRCKIYPVYRCEKRGGSGYYDARQSDKIGLCSDNPLCALTRCGNDSIGIGYVMSSRLLWQVTAGKKIIFLSVSDNYSIFFYQTNEPRQGYN